MNLILFQKQTLEKYLSYVATYFSFSYLYIQHFFLLQPNTSILFHNQDVIILWIAFLIFYCISFYYVIVRTRHSVSKMLSDLSFIVFIFFVKCDDHLEKKDHFIFTFFFLIFIVFKMILPLLLLVFLKTCWEIINKILFV